MLRFFLILFVSGPAVLAGDLALASASQEPSLQEQVSVQIARQLGDYFKVEGELQLDALRSWNLPAMAHGWHVEVVEYPTMLTSNLFVHCRLSPVEGAPVELNLAIRAQLLRDVWVAHQPIDRGQVFNPSSLEVRRVDALRERDNLPTSAADSNYAFIRTVQAGHLISWHDLAKKSLVKKGDLVDVTAADGQLQITMKAQAMENGGRGDFVTVRNPESHRDFSALVVDDGRVQVRF